MTPPIVILGAGLAGLSLAEGILARRPTQPLLLLDRRERWEHDRTWCFWALPGETDDAPIDAQWGRWQTVGPDGRTHAGGSARHPYVHLRSDRFYARALARIEAAPAARIATGTVVTGVARGGSPGWRIETTHGELRAEVVVDALGGAGPLGRGRGAGARIQQRFLGREVEVQRPIFDPPVATLMDFRVDPLGGQAMHFMYVLPFSPVRALVEPTTFGGPPVPAATRRAQIDAFLAARGAGSVRVVREERGVLPMTSRAFPSAPGIGLVAAGQAAGAGRPSSGYAYVRTRRHAAALADALLRGTPVPSAAGPARRRVLDDRFLAALRADPVVARDWFLAVAERVPPDAFARFMSDASTTRDELLMVRALARPDFIRAALLHR